MPLRRRAQARTALIELLELLESREYGPTYEQRLPYLIMARIQARPDRYAAMLHNQVES
jgi:hypothetical protein